MYENEVDVEYPGEKINAGFHVVRVQWFEFAGNVDVGTREEPNQLRHYRLLSGERLLSTTVLMFHASCTSKMALGQGVQEEGVLSPTGGGAPHRRLPFSLKRQQRRSVALLWSGLVAIFVALSLRACG